MKFFLLISAVIAAVQADVSHLSRGNSLDGYEYPRPAIPFESRPIESVVSNGYVYEKPKNPLVYPEKSVVEPQGYVYNKPQVEFPLPPPARTTVRSNPIYLPPTTPAPKCQPPKVGVYPNCQLPPCPPGYSGNYPNCNKPTTSAPLYIPPKPTGYEYPKPAIKFELPPSTTTPRPVPSTYLPPTQPPKCPQGFIGSYPNCQLPACPPGYSGSYPNCVKPTTSAPLYIPPKQTGYEYPKPVIKLELPPSTTTPRPVPSTYLPPTQLPKCPQGFIGSYPNCRLPECPAGFIGSYPNCFRPTTSAPYIPPRTQKPQGYFYPVPQKKFTIPPKAFTTQKSFPKTYLPPITPAPPKPTGYEYPTPAIKFELPPSTTTPRPVPSTYLPPTQPPKCQPPKVGVYPNCQLPPCPPGYSGIYPNCNKPTTSAPLYIPPKQTGYEYPKPVIKLELPPSTTTPRPVPSTYLPPTQPPKCQPPKVGVYPNCQLPPCPPGYSGIYPNCNRPTTSAPLYIPPKQTGYEYPKPVIKLELPPSTTTPRPVPSTYLPPTQPPKCPQGFIGSYPNCRLPECPAGFIGSYPNCFRPTTSAPYIPPRTQKPQGYFYPVPQKKFTIPPKAFTTQKSFPKTYLPPITPAPPKPTGYEYPTPAIKFELPPSPTTPRPVPSTYLPPTQPPKCQPPKVGVYPNCQLPPCPPGYSGIYPNCNRPTTSAPLYIPPKQTGYEYPKPVIKLELPPSTTTPRPVPSTYLPPTQPPKCQPPKVGVYPNCQLPACPPGYSGIYPNCNKPTTSAPLYIPPKPTGYEYPKPAIKFELPPSTTTPRPVPSTYLPPTQPPKCPQGFIGSYPNCQLPACPPGYSGSYPNCVKPTTSAPLYIPPRTTGYEYPKPAIKFTLPPSTTTPPRPVPTSPAVYLPPISTTTTTPAPTYLPPKYVTPKGDGYHYPRPAIPFDF